MLDKKGSVSTFGTFSVVDVAGTWHEMGREYGSIFAKHIRHAYDVAVEEFVIGDKVMTRERASEVATSLFAALPFRLRSFIQGMAETSGLELAQHLMLNAVETILSYNDMNSLAHVGCTGIAVWGEYATGHLIYGRNYDLYPRLKDLAEHLSVLVLHPGDGSIPIASIGLPGCVYMTTGINARGIFVELNSGEPSGGALRYNNRVPASAELMLFMLDAYDLDSLESLLFTTRSNVAYVAGVADDQTSRCYEWPVFDVKRRLSVRRPGLMVATNHFTESSWGLPRPDDVKFNYTRTRRQNLLNLAEHFKGSIDLPRMKRIMDTRIEDLGATTDDTIYQTIAVPGTMTISIKVPGRGEWTDISIGDFLSEQ